MDIDGNKGPVRDKNGHRYRAVGFPDLRAIRWYLMPFGVLAAGFAYHALHATPQDYELEEIPDRFVEMLLERPTTESAKSPDQTWTPLAQPWDIQPATHDEPEVSQETPVATAAEKAQRKQQLQQDLMSSNKLLLKLVGTTGERNTGRVADMWADEDLGIGDVEGALTDVTGVRTSQAGPLREGAISGIQVGAAQTPARVAESRSQNGRSADSNDNHAHGETWTDYGVQDFFFTELDARSTFSIDVDTASHTRIRRQLNQGYLPSHAMVRVEEFLNYFPYEYQAPKDEPFSVNFEAAKSPFHQDRIIARVGLQARKVDVTQRKPAHLTFLVDTSGSMNAPDKLGLVKTSLRKLVAELDEGDTVALVTYAGRSRVVLNPTSAADKDTINYAIGQLNSSGGTAMADGIFTAYDLAERTMRPGHVNRVIIASDGDANIGLQNPRQIVPEIRRYADKGVTLTTLGFGTGNYRDDQMEQLANDGDGNYFYVDSEREAQRVLVDKMTQTIEVVSRDTKIQVLWNPEAVLAYRLVGYENRDIADQDFRNDKVDAGEVGSGHQVTALYELVLARDPQGPLGTFQLRYKPPGPDAPASERSWSLPQSAIRTAFNLTSKDYKIATAAGYFAEVLRDSPHAEGLPLTQVQTIAQAGQRTEYAEDRELLALIRKAASLTR